MSSQAGTAVTHDQTCARELVPSHYARKLLQISPGSLGVNVREAQGYTGDVELRCILST